VERVVAERVKRDRRKICYNERERERERGNEGKVRKIKKHFVLYKNIYKWK
jgi:hypothetical protein